MVSTNGAMTAIKPYSAQNVCKQDKGCVLAISEVCLNF